MSKPLRYLVPLGLAGLAVIGLSLGWFLIRDNPDEVSLEAATRSLEPDQNPPDNAASPAGDATNPENDPEPAGAQQENNNSEPISMTGTWTVDNSTGQFDFQSATGSFVGFRLDEELRGIGEVEAVGRTGEVEGSFVIDDTTLTNATFEVNLASITTDDRRRDDEVRAALEVSDYPTATFVLTEQVTLDPAAASGDAVFVDAVGDLTIHGETQTTTFDLAAQLVEDTIVVTGMAEIAFDDFGVEVPSAPIVISANDVGIVEFQLLFTR